MRRFLLAVPISLAVHLLVVGVGVGFGLWGAMSLVPPIKMQPISVEVKDLPLGAPPAPKAEDKSDIEQPRQRRRRKRRVATAQSAVTVPRAKDAGVASEKIDAGASSQPYDGGATIDGGRRKPGDLREHGPEGSRLIAVLRLDRLRASADSDKTISAVDQLLILLPDRRRLIEGTGLNLYRDFDSLIVATPNPVDPAVTFLAVRHHLTDAALKAGLDRGANHARKPIEWQTLGGRPVGLRRRPAGATPSIMDRDDRILAMPKPSLAIMATPAYATLLLGVDPLARPSGVDAGTPNVRRTPVTRARWQSIAERIAAEEAALPDDASFMMMATGLFGPATPSGYVVPPASGASDDQRPLPVGSLGPPQVITLLVGLDPPYIEVSADFAESATADRWERDVPAWRRKLLTNPLLIVGGFSALIARTESSREGSTLHLRAETTTEELQRLLNLTAKLVTAAQQARRR